MKVSFFHLPISLISKFVKKSVTFITSCKVWKKYSERWQLTLFDFVGRLQTL
jgi:hypothetical protein